MDETTNIDMAAERAARATKTELEMENVRLRRRLMEAEQRVERMRPTERERRILDMWPRFDDGEPVWFGDEVDRMRGRVVNVDIFDNSISLFSDFDHLHLIIGERVKRPAPEALDADGVPIKVGDEVWFGSKPTVYTVESVRDGIVHLTYEGRLGTEHTQTSLSDHLSHARPDSWERLDEDAMKSMPKYWGCSFEPCDECPSKIDGKTPAEIYGVSSCSKAKELDIIRRAKRLAGVE